jgi:hypothetical protein
MADEGAVYDEDIDIEFGFTLKMYDSADLYDFRVSWETDGFKVCRENVTEKRVGGCVVVGWALVVVVGADVVVIVVVVRLTVLVVGRADVVVVARVVLLDVISVVAGCGKEAHWGRSWSAA